MLTARQQLFVAEYLKDFKPMAAAERAGYSAPPWSDEVKAAVDEGVRNLREVLAIDSALVLRECAAVAFSDATSYFSIDDEGQPHIDLSEMTPAQKAAIASIETDTYWEGRDDEAREVKKVKLRFHDKMKALELLGKNLKLFTERLEVSAVDGLAEKIAEGRLRAGIAPKQLEGGNDSAGDGVGQFRSSNRAAEARLDFHDNE
jgi:phage terminase small subunit